MKKMGLQPRINGRQQQIEGLNSKNKGQARKVSISDRQKNQSDSFNFSKISKPSKISLKKKNSCRSITLSNVNHLQRPESYSSQVRYECGQTVMGPWISQNQITRNHYKKPIIQFIQAPVINKICSKQPEKRFQTSASTIFINPPASCRQLHKPTTHFRYISNYTDGRQLPLSICHSNLNRKVHLQFNKNHEMTNLTPSISNKVDKQNVYFPPSMKTINHGNFGNRHHELSRNNTIADIWEINNEDEVKKSVKKPIDIKKIKRATKADSQQTYNHDQSFLRDKFHVKPSTQLQLGHNIKNFESIQITPLKENQEPIFDQSMISKKRSRETSPLRRISLKRLSGIKPALREVQSFFDEMDSENGSSNGSQIVFRGKEAMSGNGNLLHNLVSLIDQVDSNN